jgi:hypothetical protein
MVASHRFALYTKAKLYIIASCDGQSRQQWRTTAYFMHRLNTRCLLTQLPSTRRFRPCQLQTNGTTLHLGPITISSEKDMVTSALPRCRYLCTRCFRSEPGHAIFLGNLSEVIRRFSFVLGTLGAPSAVQDAVITRHEAVMTGTLP